MRTTQLAHSAIEVLITFATTKRRRPSPKLSYLFIVRPRCSDECQDTHGEVRVLAVGEDRAHEVQGLLEIISGKAPMSPGMLSDVVAPCLGVRTEVVAGVSGGNEAELMGLLLGCGALK